MDISYFVKKKKHWFYQNVLWNWYHQHARVFDWQHICYVWWTCFSMRQSSYLSEKLWSSYRRRLLLFACGRIHTEDSKEKQRKLSRFLKFIFRFIDDVLWQSYSRLGDLVDRIYPIELEIKDTTYTDRSAWYHDLHHEFDSEER